VLDELGTPAMLGALNPFGFGGGPTYPSADVLKAARLQVGKSVPKPRGGGRHFGLPG
jgi:hypothetical protein